MTTRSELITSIASSLHSYTGVHEQVTSLVGSVASNSLTITCSSSDGAKRGIAEIDDELIYVESVTDNTLALPPFGRGYRNTTATSHSAGAMIAFDPAFPRGEIGRALDQCIAGLFPALYQVKEWVGGSQSTDLSYDLPADLEDILRVETKRPFDVYDYWVPVVDYEVQKNTSGTQTLNIFGGLLPGWDLKVVYQARFSALTDSLAASGIPDSYEDILTYGTTSRMIRFLEPARLQLGSVENVSRANLIQAGDAGRTATQLYALYQQRVAEERRRLLEQYPARPNFLGR